MGHHPYLSTLISSAVISLVLAIFFWSRHPAPGARMFSALMAGVLMISVGYVLEVSVATLDAFRVANNIEYIGLVTAPVLWMLFTTQYTHVENWFTRHAYLLFIIPSITLALVWTNDFHGFMWYGARLEEYEDFIIQIKTYNYGFWVHTFYSYTLVIYGLSILASKTFKAPRLYRNQIIVFLCAVTLPLVWNVIYIFKAPPTYHLDMGPPAFIASAIIIAVGLFRFRIMDIVPIARNTVVETMRDGVIVLDTQNRVIDLNPAAECLLQSRASKLVGESASVWLSENPELGKFLTSSNEVEIQLGSNGNGKARHYSVHLTPLYDKRQKLTGRLIVMREITERKKMEHEMRLLSQRIISLQDEERASISRELHDQVGQDLTVLTLMLSKIKASGVSQEASSTLEKARDQLRKAITNIRSISVNLYPSMLDTLGLVPTLTWFIEDLQKRTEIRIHFSHSGLDVSFASQVKLCVYRIVQEALTNVIRHSEAKQVYITINASKVLHLEIRDKGKGFDPAQSPESSSGIRGMRERARSLGGTLKVESSPGTGTRIRVELPYRTATEHNSGG